MLGSMLTDLEMMPIVAQTKSIAVERYAEPTDLAEMVEWLVTFENQILLGQIIYVDGGTDAILRPDQV